MSDRHARVELELVEALQQIIVGYSEFLQSFPESRWECRVEIREGKLMVVKGLGGMVGPSLSNFNLYQEEIENCQELKGWMIEKLVHFAIEATTNLDSILHPESGHHLYVGPSGDLTDDYIEVLPDNLQSVIERANLLWKKALESLPADQVSAGSEDRTSTSRDPIRWTGSDTDLAHLIVTLREKDYIKFDSNEQGFKQAAMHFVGKQVKSLNPDQLRRLLDQRRGQMKANPFGCIPKNPRPES